MVKKLFIFFLLWTIHLEAFTLQQAFARTGFLSYDLQVKNEEIKIKEGEIWQASLYPNPALDVEVDGFYGNGPFNGFNGTVTTYEIQTLLELGGKRYERTQAAKMDKLLAEWDLEEGRRSLCTKLEIAFIDVFVAQEKLKLYQRFYEITSNALEVALQNLQLGKESKVNVHKTKISSLQASLAVEKQESELFVLKTILANFWNETCPDFAFVEYDLETIPFLLDRCSYETMLTRYPGLMRQKLLIDRALREVAVQKSNAYPDVLLSLGVDHQVNQGQYAMRVELNVPLPIFNTNQGKIFSAKHQIEQSQYEYQRYYLDLLLAFRKVYQNLEVAKNEVLLYQHEIVPSLHEVYHGTVEAYDEGKVDIISLLDQEKFYVESKISYLQAMSSFHKFYAELMSYVRGIL